MASSAREETWRNISNQAQVRLYNSIPKQWRLPAEKLPPPDRKDVTGYPAECGLLSPVELEITDSFATDIVRRIAAGEWTAEAVAMAFCKRAAVAHQITNCLSVIMFEEAIARAKHLDAEFAKTGRVTGPLHGLPVSLKDNFNVPGFPSSVGFTAWALQPVEQESTIVSLLRDLGAVHFVKTNVPTAMMIPETVNNCYGRTVNPLNRELTSGGSSGGESALIALHGSPLGVGTDIGGSLRIPAACCGLFTLRPSFGRFPNFDARSGLAGQEAVMSVHGPMARSLADCRLYTDNVVAAKPWLRDPKCIPIPWRSISLTRPKLRIGLLRTNGMINPTPPIARALHTISTKLSAAGHEIVEWTPDGLVEAMVALGTFFVADGGQTIQAILSATNEPWRPEMDLYRTSKALDVADLWKVQSQRTVLQKSYLDRCRAAGIDVILGPTTPYVAPRNGCFRNVSYTGVWNVLDYSCLSFPTGLYADAALDVYEDGFVQLSEDDGICKQEFDPRDVDRLPISLQLTAGRLEEEFVMAVAERILEDIK